MLDYSYFVVTRALSLTTIDNINYLYNSVSHEIVLHQVRFIVLHIQGIIQQNSTWLISYNTRLMPSHLATGLYSHILIPIFVWYFAFMFVIFLYMSICIFVHIWIVGHLKYNLVYCFFNTSDISAQNWSAGQSNILVVIVIVTVLGCCMRYHHSHVIVPFNSLSISTPSHTSKLCGVFCVGHWINSGVIDAVCRKFI